ncbi:hypothetical protein OG2516_16494, partial [Oceanicola granulosus HTCC2516]
MLPLAASTLVVRTRLFVLLYPFVSPGRV